MRNFSTFIFSLIGGAAIVSAGTSEVTTLTKKTFTEFINENELVLAEFFAPWCGHCKALAPEYEEAAKALKEKNIKLVQIDCVDESDLCKEQGVEGYPTLKVFKGLENVSLYQGARKAPAIISHMTKQSLPAVSILKNEMLEDFKSADKVVVVAFYNADDMASNVTFSTVAEKLRDEFLFGANFDADLAKTEGVTAPAVILYKSFDEGKVILSEEFNAENIEKFVTVSSLPLIGEVGPETYANYMSTGIPLAYIFAETEEERKSLSEILRPVAEQHKGKINFATIDAKAFGGHAVNLNLKAEKFPAFAIHNMTDNKKYPYDQELVIDAETIGKHASTFVEGKLDPVIKSEEVPETQDGPVTVVVAKNYEEIVLDDTKDVILEIYAPWCGYCKALAPKYDILGQLYSQAGLNDKVVIAKVDATANDIPDEIDGFPTIKLFKAGDKSNPITFKGGRTVEDLIEFVKEGTHQMSVEYTKEMKDKLEASKEEEEDLEPIEIDEDELSEMFEEDSADSTSEESTESDTTSDATSEVGSEEKVEEHDEL